MKREDLQLVTPEQFKKFKPCWLLTEDGLSRYERVAAQRAEWNALDVLDLEDVNARDKLWAVLRKAFLPPMLLHEFACRCAEWALTLVENADPRSVEAIRVKRRWMAGEATYSELYDAWRDAQSAWLEARDECYRQSAGRHVYVDSAWNAMVLSSAAVAVAQDLCSQALTVAVEAMRIIQKNSAYSAEHEIAMLRALIDEWEEQA